MRSENLKIPVVLITGASTGIGLALARLLSKDRRFRVVITARQNSLSRFVKENFRQSHRFLIRPLDITSPEDREHLFAEITELWGGIDILINSAGVSYRAVFEHMTASDLEHQLKANFLGPMELIRLVLPSMRAKRSGRIINISSVGGMMAMPTMSSYSASKFALEGASEALWYEMKPWGINVSLIQPGFVHSQSFRNVLFTDESEDAFANHQNPYHAYYRNMASFIEWMMTHAFSTPEKVAKTILSIMTHKNPPLRVPATIDAWVFGLLRKFLPRGIYHRLLYIGLPGIRAWAKPELAELPIQAREFTSKSEESLHEERKPEAPNHPEL